MELANITERKSFMITLGWLLHKAQHGIVHPGLLRAFTCSHHAARDIAISDQADRFQVLFRVDHSDLPAVVLDHHLGCLLNTVLGCAARKIGVREVLGMLHGFARSNCDVSNSL